MSWRVSSEPKNSFLEFKLCVDLGILTVTRSHTETSVTQTWPRTGFLLHGVTPRGSGVYPDSLGVDTVEGMNRVQEFSQDQPWIWDSTQYATPDLSWGVNRVFPELLDHHDRGIRPELSLKVKSFWNQSRLSVSFSSSLILFNRKGNFKVLTVVNQICFTPFIRDE